MVRVRIAPSPTGYLHIGTARTALFNYLFTRKNRGSFIVRIEDTDQERSKGEYEKDILEGLQWLGIDYDEGPDRAGQYGPYRQSERFSIYKKYLTQLNDKGFVYDCYCTKEELEEEREMQVLAKLPPRYSGKCSALTNADRERLKKEDRSSTLRFRIDRGQKIIVKDSIRGELSFDTTTLDDFIIAKDFDTPLYNFAVVVDDHLMEITHIIRGEEHISNIPKQVLLERALGLRTPEFAHLPLILNPDRTKLSKRQNKVSLLEYRADGYLPEALINFMALLGWNPGGEQEMFTLDALAKLFTLDQVNKSGSIFDTIKLDWFNAHYIRSKEITELTRLCLPYFISAGYLIPQSNESSGFMLCATNETVPFSFVQKVVENERDRIHKLSEITLNTQYYFVDDIEYEAELLVWKKTSAKEIHAGLLVCKQVIEQMLESDFTVLNIETQLKQAISKKEINNGVVLWPFRVALTGLAKSPSPFSVAAIIGKKKTCSRIDSAVQRMTA